MLYKHQPLFHDFLKNIIKNNNLYNSVTRQPLNSSPHFQIIEASSLSKSSAHPLLDYVLFIKKKKKTNKQNKF
jgi:hypothetical protein